MIQICHVVDKTTRAKRTPFRTARPEHDVRDATLLNRAGTHDARFQCHVQDTPGESPVPDAARSVLKRGHLRMGRGVFANFPRIVAVSDEIPVGTYDHCPDRRFSDAQRRFCLCQGDLHIVRMISHPLTSSA